MSTLKANNVQHLDSSSASIQTTQGGGTILTGVSTIGNANLVVESNASEGVRITSGGDVGIGTDNPGTELHVQGTNGYAELRLSGNSGSGGSLEYYDAATKLADIYADSSSNLVFRTTASNTERLRITTNGDTQVAAGSSLYLADGNLVFSTSGTGIDFSATADGSGTMTSELLDDYEEGTFTPTIVSGVDDGSGGDPSFDRLAGRYIKIGRKVHVDIYMRFTTAFCDGSIGRIGGLPYVISSDSYGDVGASSYTRGGGTSTFHNTTSDITTNYGSAGNANFYMYKDGGSNFLFGGADNADLSGLYWIGFFEYITD